MKENKGIARRLKKHDESALEELMQRYTPLVYTIISEIGRGTLSRADMEEAAADTFLSLWKNANKTKDETLKGYICSIAKTKAFDKLDSVKRNIVLDIDNYDAEDDFSLQGAIEEKDINRVLGSIIESIDPPDRDILIRYYFFYQKISVIADQMKINPSTVKTKLSRTRAKLKRELTERGYHI